MNIMKISQQTHMKKLIFSHQKGATIQRKK